MYNLKKDNKIQLKKKPQKKNQMNERRKQAEVGIVHTYLTGETGKSLKADLNTNKV